MHCKCEYELRIVTAKWLIIEQKPFRIYRMEQRKCFFQVDISLYILFTWEVKSLPDILP